MAVRSSGDQGPQGILPQALLSRACHGYEPGPERQGRTPSTGAPQGILSHVGPQPRAPQRASTSRPTWPSACTWAPAALHPPCQRWRWPRVARPALLAERPLRLAQKRAVVWFRAGDLRATDHAGLAAAAQAEGMACCYVFELNELARLSPRRLALLQAAVEALKRELSKRGVQLQVAVAEDGAAAVSGMCRELGATEVYMHEDPVDLRVQGLRT